MSEYKKGNALINIPPYAATTLMEENRILKTILLLINIIIKLNSVIHTSFILLKATIELYPHQYSYYV